MLISSDLPAEKQDYTVELTDDRKEYGRTPGATGIPQFLRNTIAIAAHEDSRTNVAKAFSISPQEVSLIKHAKLPDSKDEFGKDRQNPDSEANTEIRSAVKSHLESARDIAASRLLDCLNSVTPERIKLLPKLHETMQVAESMSRIIERTTPKVEAGRENDAKFIFIVPETRRPVTDYKVIEVEQPLED